MSRTFPTRTQPPLRHPTPSCRVLLLEVPCDGAGGEDMAVASFPAFLAFLKFAGSRLLRVSGFAPLPVPPVETQSHA